MRRTHSLDIGGDIKKPMWKVLQSLAVGTYVFVVCGFVFSAAGQELSNSSEKRPVLPGVFLRTGPCNPICARRFLPDSPPELFPSERSTDVAWPITEPIDTEKLWRTSMR